MNKLSEKIYLLKNGLLFLLEILPRESIKKEYGILKLYSLMPNHSDNAVNIYDLYLTPDRDILKELRREYIKKVSESNISSKKRLFMSISRKLYGEFYASAEKTVIILKFKNMTRLSFILNEDLYRKFLRENLGLSKKDIENIKKIAVSGRDRYFRYIEDFLQFIKKINESDAEKFEKYDKYIVYLKSITENLDFPLDYVSLYKRTYPIMPVKVKIFDNGGFIISRDQELKIPYNFNFINDEIIKQYEKGRELFFEDYRTRGLKLLNASETEKFRKLLCKLRLRSQENINSYIIKEMLYYCSIIKTNYPLFKKKFNFKDNEIYPMIAINLGMFTAFSRHFPANPLVSTERDVFISDFLKKTDMDDTTPDNLIKFTGDIIFLFECAEDLKYLSSVFKNKFEFKGEIEAIRNLSYRLIRDIFTRFIVSHDIFSTSVFIMFILAINKNTDIPIRQIYTLDELKVSHYSIPLHIGAIVSRVEKTKTEGRPLLNITDKKFKQKIRKALVKLILERSLNKLDDLNISALGKPEIVNKILEFFEEIRFFYAYRKFNEFLKPLNQKILLLIKKLESASDVFPPKIRAQLKEIKEMVKDKIKEISEGIPEPILSFDLNMLKKYYNLNKEGLSANPKTATFENFKESFGEWLKSGRLPACRNKLERLLIKSIFKNIKIILDKDKG